MWETRVRSLGWEDPLEKEMATHSSTLAWRIPWREERGRLQSMGLQRVGYDWATSLSFSSVRSLGPTLCNPIYCSTPGLPVYHQLPELAQTHVHWVGDAIQRSHPLSFPSLPAFNPSPTSASLLMRQFFSSGGQSIGVSASTSVLPKNVQDWFSLGWTSWIFLQSKGLSRVFSNTTVQKHQFFCTQLSL